ncbi:IS66 family transposase [Acholeplasma laidlawii]|uniref:IS66 family transposase n=1 Tax=Acholeplasma laidlawii TaxID=2148 RepID=UPI003F8E89AA
MNLKEALKELNRLKKENEAQAVMIFKLNAQLNEALAANQSLVQKHQIERIKTFIPKAERLDAVMINETEHVIKKNKTKGIRQVRKKNFEGFDFEKHVTDVWYEKPDETNCSTCGKDLIKASSKIRYLVEAVPASLKVTKIIKESCKCIDCNKQDNRLYYPVSTSLFPGSLMSHSFAAYIAYHKYELGIPFHHLSRHIKEVLNLDMSKQNLANTMAKLSNIIKPVYEAMKKDLLNNTAGVIHADETTLVVSKKPDADIDRKYSYVYVYQSSYYDKQVSIYDFHETRSIGQTAKWLENYEGVIVCDDYKGYTKLSKENPKIKLQRCWAHVRRRFMDIVKALKADERKNSYAHKILELIKELFYFESIYKREERTPSEIVDLRNKDQQPILDKLEDLLFNHTYKPNSAIEGAVNYAKNIWSDLNTYLSNGYVEISNNIAERAVRPFVINRKVFMTSGSYDGARYTTVLFSMIRTAIINNINVSKYLEYVLDNIKDKPINELLPYSDKLPESLKNI